MLLKPYVRRICVLSAVLVSAQELEAQVYTRRTPSGSIEATNIPDGHGFALTYPGKGRLIHSRGFRGRYKGQFDAIIEAASAQHGVSSGLIHAVIRAESSYDQFAVSSKGAQGLMQLMPPTARRFGVGNAFDARQNIFGGARYLKLLLDMFGGNLNFALAAYNAGENAVKRYGGIPPYKETQRYVKKIRSWLPSLNAGAIAMSFAPRQSLAQVQAQTPKKVMPAPPRVYYKYRDSRGVLHIANQRPPDGVPYVMIRALP
jgi:hypothetical protein